MLGATTITVATWLPGDHIAPSDWGVTEGEIRTT